jgi:hypothetical protein
VRADNEAIALGLIRHRRQEYNTLALAIARLDELQKALYARAPDGSALPW